MINACLRESATEQKRGKNNMRYVYSKLNELLNSHRTANVSGRNNDSRSALDFYTHDAVSAICFAQDSFKSEQR